MKRGLALMAIALMLVGGAAVLAAPALVDHTAWARAGGGSSGGSRGSRSYSAPVRPSSPATPSRPAATPSTLDQGRRSGWGAGLMGGLGGLLLGGLLGGLLFGGLGHGLFGGIGLLELLLIAGLAYLAFSFMRRRRTPEPAIAGGYAGAGAGAPAGTPWSAGASTAASSTVLERASGPSDLDVGTSHIRQMDGSFDPGRLASTASDLFFKVQAAWMARDMGSVRNLVTPEMYERLDAQCAELRAQRRINRLENIAVRSADLTEAWQERGQDFATVAFVANVLDYTTDEAGRVVDGSRTEPVKFEEFWTFVRPVGPNPWKLTAIQQPA
ncbi:MAG: Tim44 domain-containing protein [Candidatus Rokubacteria bacterium]|nr:Tim44 domain-containing protein [Candidatus Rokubacteria bacterium]